MILPSEISHADSRPFPRRTTAASRCCVDGVETFSARVDHSLVDRRNARKAGAYAVRPFRLSGGERVVREACPSARSGNLGRRTEGQPVGLEGIARLRTGQAAAGDGLARQI